MRRGFVFCSCCRFFRNLFNMAIFTYDAHAPIDAFGLQLKDGRVAWRSTGDGVAVLHGMWNTNMDAVCKHLQLLCPAKHNKKISQDDIAVVVKATRFLGALLLCGLLALGVARVASML